ncbi:MAG: hypothetical protein CL581_17645 [Alteromonadaceae bacterium]|nr:hypothetical protein [Alteromonadaceae bacterium]MBH84080.1 hypothetical protein [Alteromonadaceae bacterium]|tara:strand:- start:18115 stop:18621 length:507 start_codon:yes stop_codon:yes gene_type:complete
MTSSRYSIRAISIVAAMLALSACRAPGATENTPETVGMCIQTATTTHKLVVERAVTSTERAKGLMGREALQEDHGMLFVYDEERPPEATFWMYRTFIPLDIAYADANGTIKAIKKMLPCASDNSSQCAHYAAGVSYHLALEMPQGYFRKRSISVGDRLVMGSGESSCS